MITRKGIAIPEKFARTLGTDARALAIFEAMRPSCQNRYVKWVSEAKREETKARRLKKVNEMILDYGRRHPNRRSPP